MMPRIWAVAAFFISILFAASPAQAQLQVCNQTSYIVYAAVGIAAQAKNITQGWTRIVPGDCDVTIKQPLTRTKYFLFARSSRAYPGAERDWGGNVDLCSKDTNFALLNPVSADCGMADAFTEPYAPVNTHGFPAWTTTLTDETPHASAGAVRERGVERLLLTLGYRISGAALNTTRDKSIDDFRKRAKLAATASSADLFEALEKAATKISAPMGYSVCNETKGGDIWAAIAEQNSGAISSSGWWQIAQGACAKAIAAPLAFDKVYLHVEGHNKPAMVSGPTKFCITNITFQVSGNGDCKKRGLTEAGFALTATKGQTGYVAHIGDKGLASPAKR
jgi:uncharacterized membrane protein